MSLRSLLVLVDQSPACTQRTALAVGLAKAHGCRVTGLAPTDLVDLPVRLTAELPMAELVARTKDALHDQAERAAERFREQCQCAGLDSVTTVVEEAEAVASLVRHACSADLTVVSQANPDTPERERTQALVENLLLRSARPTLIVPYAGNFTDGFRHVMVAWNDTREATRALSDALPFLQAARQVTLISWDQGVSGTTGLQSRLDAVGQWLSLQGVQSDVRLERTSIGIADAMLSRAADLGADLIVMGAYSHSRLAELVLGGATRGLLKCMTVPVLMSR
jgi:nucleotide-binding universal stress UspA family protein